MYSRSLFVWVVVGGFFGDGLYFAISKVYESRFNGSPKARAPPEQPALLTIYLTFMFNKK